MVTKVLCVAEKPSIAKAVANHLSDQVQTRNVNGNPYVKNYQFHYNFPQWGHCDVVMTSVLGHLFSHDFDQQYKSWRSCDPSELFEAPVTAYVQDDKKPVAKNIETQAKYSHILYIWTDCDREGENIGAEIRDVAVKSNRRLGEQGKIVRAQFSNIGKVHIINAARRPTMLDEAQVNAVASRTELDLRIGSSFTRQLTLSLDGTLPYKPGEDKARLVSYGGCQFPTLGFVVDRYFRVKNFVPEQFWLIKVMHEKAGIKVNFRWSRNHLFDRMIAVILYEQCLDAKTARVTKVQTKPTSKWKPLPLTTVELQKCGSRFLRMDSASMLNHAEKLYQKGFISYPRTETDQFDREMDLRTLVQKQTQSQNWGQFAQGLINGGFSQPRNGRNNDKAHPPIHPVTFAAPNVLNAEERKVYEFVVRRFLACCSTDAKGSKTDIGIQYGPEAFNASGLVVLERNYLDVYPYDKWTSSQDLPQFQVGEVFEPTEAILQDGKTSAPGYLTESELITLMDANGIGTDATMAEHIQKIQEREYAFTRSRGRQAGQRDDDVSASDDDDAAGGRGRGRGRGRGQGRGRGDRGRGRGGRGGAAENGGRSSGIIEFIPTTLGVALVEGYENMGFEISLAKPFLRKEMELKMKAICDGQKTRQEVVHETIEQYRDVYIRTRQRLNLMHESVRKYVLNGGG